MPSPIDLRACRALARGAAIALYKTLRRGSPAPVPAPLPAGISVVIPSRNGRALLERLLPGVFRELEGLASEVIVCDNGSSDGTAAFLEGSYPACVVEAHPAPLSFAAAVNRGLRRARLSHACLLNNDMIVEPGFFAALRRAFDCVPDLFCATAQIFFPAGARREETGKAMLSATDPRDFPVRCELPLEGEDHTYVLYGSGGCSLYDAAKLRALGLVDEIYSPAYVEDLDLGYRGWARGWPTVFVAGAVVEHRHRATTSRYFSEEQLEAALEINYLRFLARAVASPAVFWKLWRRAVGRLRRLSADGRPAARIAIGAPVAPRPAAATAGEAGFLALTTGKVAVFPGRGSGEAEVLWCEGLRPPGDILQRSKELVLVERGAPQGAFEEAVRLTRRKWLFNPDAGR